jgi:hypothetical protein
MKKVASILALAVFALSMVSCDKDNASNDELYEVVASDREGETNSGGSGGN